jgi:hypothetical protein
MGKLQSTLIVVVTDVEGDKDTPSVHSCVQRHWSARSRTFYSPEQHSDKVLRDSYLLSIAFLHVLPPIRKKATCNLFVAESYWDIKEGHVPLVYYI